MVLGRLPVMGALSDLDGLCADGVSGPRWVRPGMNGPSAAGDSDMAGMSKLLLADVRKA